MMMTTLTDDDYNGDDYTHWWWLHTLIMITLADDYIDDVYTDSVV